MVHKSGKEKHMAKNRRILLILPIGILIFMTACQLGNGDRHKKPVQKIESVCIWENGSLRVTPSVKGKWLSSLSLGETVYWLGESAIDSSSNRKIEYLKIQLSDSTTGWASRDVLVTNAKVGAIKEETLIYMRPDLVTLTDKQFTMMEMIAITQEKDEWVRVVGRHRNKKGWIRNDAVTVDKTDVTVAILATKILDKENNRSMNQKIQDIIAKSPYPDSFFVQKLKEMAY